VIFQLQKRFNGHVGEEEWQEFFPADIGDDSHLYAVEFFERLGEFVVLLFYPTNGRGVGFGEKEDAERRVHTVSKFENEESL